MNKIILATAVAATALFSACGGNHGPKPAFNNEVDTLSYELGMANGVSEAELKQYLGDPRTGSDTAYVAEFMEGLQDALAAAKDKKKAAYYAGLQVGSQMRSSITQIETQVFAGDSTQKLNMKNFISGFKATVNGKFTALVIDSVPVNRQSAMMDVNTRIRKMAAAAMEKQYADEKKASEEYIAAKAKEEGIQQLPGGTLYKVITEGKGEPAKPGQKINVIYEGKLMDGTVFDSSSKHPGPDGASVAMYIGQSIPGFDNALKAMPAGSTWEIHIPYDQAYNEHGSGQIPPFAAISFTITVSSIEASK